VPTVREAPRPRTTSRGAVDVGPNATVPLTEGAAEHKGPICGTNFRGVLSRGWSGAAATLVGRLLISKKLFYHIDW